MEQIFKITCLYSIVVKPREGPYFATWLLKCLSASGGVNFIDNACFINIVLNVASLQFVSGVLHEANATVARRKQPAMEVTLRKKLQSGTNFKNNLLEVICC